MNDNLKRSIKIGNAVTLLGSIAYVISVPISGILAGQLYEYYDQDRISTDPEYFLFLWMFFYLSFSVTLSGLGYIHKAKSRNLADILNEMEADYDSPRFDHGESAKFYLIGLLWVAPMVAPTFFLLDVGNDPRFLVLLPIALVVGLFKNFRSIRNWLTFGTSTLIIQRKDEGTTQFRAILRSNRKSVRLDSLTCSLYPHTFSNEVEINEPSLYQLNLTPGNLSKGILIEFSIPKEILALARNESPEDEDDPGSPTVSFIIQFSAFASQVKYNAQFTIKSWIV